MIADRDFIYENLPWRAGGRTREGLDCAGLALLFLREEFGLDVTAPDTTQPACIDLEPALQAVAIRRGEMLQRGDLLFFRYRTTGKITHVAVMLDGSRVLHIVHGCPSRIDADMRLCHRLGLRLAYAVKPADAPALAGVLHSAALGDASTIVLLVISIALSAISYAIAPKLSRQGNRYGRYGFDALVTKNSPEQPLPDLLGSVVVAGNSPYTQQREQSASATATSQKANKIVVLASAPSEEIDYQTGLKINGMGWNDAYFFSGSAFTGNYINPTQTKDEAVSGTILGDSNAPSISLYEGDYGLTVPVDIRASYDREFPVYGLSGCTYLVFRLVDSTKYQNFNVTCRVKCRKCRTFDENGFVVTTVTTSMFNTLFQQTATGDGWRYYLRNGSVPQQDIKAVRDVEVFGVAHTEMSASNQSGNVYSINYTKGYIELLTQPNVLGSTTLEFDYYVREWSQNPAMQLVYLLTEKGRGLGLPESAIDWDAAVAFRDYCDEEITYQSANGEVTGPRWRSDYAIDFRKPIQEHIQAILDASHAVLFVSGGKWVMKAISAESSVFDFTTSNILEGSFSSEMIDRAERANRVKLLFHSEEAHNAETEVIVDHAADQAARAPRAGNNGVVDANLKLAAVTNPAQAERLAMTFLEEEVSSRFRATWKTTIKGLALQNGDVVTITHPSRPSWTARPFRIEEVNHDAEDRLEITAVDYTPGAYL